MLETGQEPKTVGHGLPASGLRKKRIRPPEKIDAPLIWKLPNSHRRDYIFTNDFHGCEELPLRCSTVFLMASEWSVVQICGAPEGKSR